MEVETPADAASVAARARTALRSAFGYPGFRPGQAELVEAVLRGRDALGILPTGGGKSVCYQVPALLLPGMTLVVSPLISLMADQVARCIEAGIPAAFLNSSLSPEAMRSIEARARSGEVRVLLVAPERFANADFRALLRQLRVSLVAVDEAHCISEWGHDFRPSYLKLGEVRSLVSCPLLALTATATPRVREEIASVLGLRDPVRVVKSFDRPNLAWHVLEARDVREKFQLLRRLVTPVLSRGTEAESAAMVYAATRRGVETIRTALASLGLPAEAYHAGLSPDERVRVQERFMEPGSALVVATNAFGMGIDKPTVRLVVHMELPRTLEAYYQEAGRAGRDGEPADCVAFHAPSDRELQVGFIDRTHPPLARLRRVRKALRRLVGPGRRALLPLEAVRDALHPRPSAEEVLSALRVLSDAGAVRLMGTREDPSGSLAVDVGVRSGSSSLAAARRRRSAELEKLDGIQAFARTRSCRRAHILTYFGESAQGGPCNGCDRCGSERPLFGAEGSR